MFYTLWFLVYAFEYSLWITKIFRSWSWHCDLRKWKQIYSTLMILTIINFDFDGDERFVIEEKERNIVFLNSLWMDDTSVVRWWTFNSFDMKTNSCFVLCISHNAVNFHWFCKLLRIFYKCGAWMDMIYSR